MEKKESIIYGVRTGDTYHYIGKTGKLILEENGEIKKSRISTYGRQKASNVSTENQDFSYDQLKTVDGEWYDEKLHEVVDKTRDAHTIQRLSESKFKKIVQYDADGNLMKVWDSGKEVGIKIFKDYVVAKDGTDCKTALYYILKSPNLKNRFRHNSYWFKETELRSLFNCIPKKIEHQKDT